MKMTLYISNQYFDYLQFYDFRDLVNRILGQFEFEAITPKTIEKIYPPRYCRKYIPVEIKGIKAKYKQWKDISQMGAVLERILTKLQSPNEIRSIFQKGIDEEFPYGINVFLAEQGCIVSTDDYQIRPEDVPKIKKMIDDIKTRDE